MTEPTDASRDLALYGLDDKAKPRAGLVAAADRDMAVPIAAGLNFQLLPISTAQQRVTAAELSPVSLSENGYAAVRGLVLLWRWGVRNAGFASTSTLEVVATTL